MTTEEEQMNAAREALIELFVLSAERQIAQMCLSMLAAAQGFEAADAKRIREWVERISAILGIQKPEATAVAPTDRVQ